MKSMKKLMMLLLSFCLVLSMSVPVSASDSGSDTNVISNARDGILQVNTYYQPKDKTKPAIPLFGGTSFLVNEKTVVTCWHILHFDDSQADVVEMEKALEEETGEPFFSNPNALTGSFYYEIVVKRDVVIKASILQESKDMDFAILELDSQIYDRKVLSLDDTESIKETDNVFALGFSAAPISNKDVQYYTNSDVVVTNGIVSMIGDVNTVPRIQHSAKISAGNSGGPLLNENGVVVGVNTGTAIQDSDYSYATQIGEVISIMKSMGYQYTGKVLPPDPEPDTDETDETDTTDTSDTETPETKAAVQDTTEEKLMLQEAIDEAGKIDSDKYEETGIEAFEEALENAKIVMGNASATAGELKQAADDLDSARTALKEKKNNMMMYIVIGAIALVVVIIIIIIIAVSSGKKKKAQQRNGRPTSPPSGSGSQTGQAQSVNRGFNPSPATPPVSSSDGNFGETSVLDAGAGETTVLSSGPVSNGYLIRKKTGEKIELRKSVFLIGKERSKVDYCISDNTSISRVHAKFLAKGDGCYIVDQKSTNSTFVNGSRLTPLVEVKLEDRATVKISDELFEYHRG